jgi:hypothetical protein
VKFYLRDVSGWTENVVCTTTTLCAITGEQPDYIAALISNRAALRGQSYPADPSQPFNIGDCLDVIRDLGGEFVQTENYSQCPYGSRALISQYLGRPPSSELKLVFGENESVDVTHVFALQNGELVDTYTFGRKVTANLASVPQACDVHRVKRVFTITEANPDWISLPP